MTSDSLTAEQIATFLAAHPDFFVEHADVFATLAVPHPHESRAISLGERQILTLRQRSRDLEQRLGGLVHYASTNEGISQRVTAWCAGLLAEPDGEQIPLAIRQGLTQSFGLQEVALRWWTPGETASTASPGASGVSPPVTATACTYAESLSAPYTGTGASLEVAGWLGLPPASLAAIPLRASAQAPVAGLLVLGSDQPERFTADMGTTFLVLIGQLASAALARLHPALRA